MKAVKVRATTKGTRKRAHVRKIKTVADKSGSGAEIAKKKVAKSAPSTGGGFKSPMHERMHNLRAMRGKSKKV